MRVKEGYTQDGTVDLKGRPILRSKGGRWKACSFIVGYELFERLAFFGVLTNLVVYLSTRPHEGTVKSANNVTRIGTTWIHYLGRYWTFVISSAVYFAGMCLLFLSVTLPALKPPICGPGVLLQDCNDRPSSFQVAIFYAALYIMALGNGGTKSNISTIGADQFDVFEPKDKAQKLSFFNWWMFTIYLGQLCANTVIVYIQDNVGWSLGYGLPTIGLAISTIVFLVGTPFYKHKVRSGSPFTHMAMVLVAALRKCKVPLPNEPKDLYELKPDEYARAQKRRIDHTPSLRILDKAAVKTGLSSPWRLCPVTRVEETKQMIKMIPVLIVTFVPAMQGITLKRSLGPNFDIPHKKSKRGNNFTKNGNWHSIAYYGHADCLLLMERKRLQLIMDNGITGKSVIVVGNRFPTIVPLPIFILLPQYVLMGVSASFFLVANLEFFYDQAPESMKSIGTSYYTSSLGIGQFLRATTFFFFSVKRVKEERVWRSHLDYYYVFLGILSFLNLM
ncbi:hypothetical protein MKW92_006965 [Papaver armeniacum]|nr:hypothetical protein MKW92_006965 [Papaver armeniacum]